MSENGIFPLQNMEKTGRKKLRNNEANFAKLHEFSEIVNQEICKSGIESRILRKIFDKSN